MSRTLRNSVIGGGASSTAIGHRRGLSHNGASNHKDPVDERLDLFSKNRRSLSVASSDESDVSLKLGRISIGSAKQAKSGLDDLLSSAEGGKHDYDWLLTPPGTPLVPSLDGNESQAGLMAPRNGPLVRSVSTTKASRLSVSQSENNHAVNPVRSSSVTRPSISGSSYSTYYNKSASILNTSSASVSSYTRPATPTSRSSSITRPSTPSARPAVSRSTTPSKPRPPASISSVDRPRPSINSRPSTPTTRSQVSTNPSCPPVRTTSRPTTPRRYSAPSSSVSGPSTPSGHNLSNGRSVTSVSRPSSPAPRLRPSSQPMQLPDFPLETPPNLRTSLPERPLSAGRSRPGVVALTAKGNTDTEFTPNTVAIPRRQSSPVVTRGRPVEPTGRARTIANGQLADGVDSRRELPTRKAVKKSADSTGFGRTISKKSLDMAIRHMDIRNGSNGFRPVTGTNLFPQSIRSGNLKVQLSIASVNSCLSMTSNDAVAVIADNGNRFSESGSEEDKSQSSAKLTNSDIYESSRYDMILLKEDLNNTNWLRGIDDKSDQESIFDTGFELLPEPFDPL